MEGEISRRVFMKRSALAIGAVVASGLACVGGGLARGPGALPGGKLKEEMMPHIIVKLYPGRSEEQKAQLAEAIVKDVVAIIKCGEESVSVTFQEVKPEDWAEKVYKPDIVNAPGKLYRKPGYSM